MFFRPSDSWDSKATSEWTLHLDLGAKEEALLVALGDTWVAVGTNKQYVRLISHTGIQSFILSLSGPPVSMVGQAALLAVVFHDGVPLPGHQNLGLLVLDVTKKKQLYRGKCVISPRATLTWIGFSDVGVSAEKAEAANSKSRARRAQVAAAQKRGAECCSWNCRSHACSPLFVLLSVICVLFIRCFCAWIRTA